MTKKIEVMVNGERLYVPPWAITWHEGKPYLNTQYTGLAKPFGTATQTVDKLSNGGFCVHTPDPRFFNADGTPRNK